MSLERFSFAEFCERRARRILPALFLVTVCCLPLAWLVMFPAELKAFAQSLMSVGLLASNVLFWMQSGYFAVDAEQKPLLHTWSLAVEEQFYLAFPIILLLVWRYRRDWLLPVVIALAAASFALCEIGWRLKPSATFYLAPTRAWELLIGAACAIWQASRPVAGSTFLSGLGLVAILASVLLYDKTTPFPSYYALLPTLGTALVLLYARPGTFAHRLLSLRLLVVIGLLSYSAYLWHQPLIAFARMYKTVHAAEWILLGAALFSFPLAYLSWRFVELPFRDARSGPIRSRRTLLTLSATGLAAFVVTGLAGHAAVGFPDRFDARTLRLAQSVDDIGRFRGCMEIGANATRDTLANCRLGAPGSTPTFVLLGDSHAGAIADGLDRAALAMGRAGFVVGVNACPPVADAGTHWSGTRETCPAFQSGLVALVERLRVRHVILHAMWESFDDGNLVPAHAGGPTAGSLENGLLDSMRRLRERGVSVVVIGSTPRAAFIVPTTLARWRHLMPGRDLRPELADFLRENRTARKVFSGPAFRSLARLVDVHQVFCGSGLTDRCDLDDGSNAYFYDQHHLTRTGSLLLADRLRAALEHEPNGSGRPAPPRTASW